MITVILSIFNFLCALYLFMSSLDADKMIPEVYCETKSQDQRKGPRAKVAEKELIVRDQRGKYAGTLYRIFK